MHKTKTTNSNNIIAFFVLLAFLITVPTWFSEAYATDDMAYYVSDIVVRIRLALLPLLAFILVAQRIRFVFLAYFILSIMNLITLTLGYVNMFSSWMPTIQVGLALLILVYLSFNLWRIYKWNGIK